MAIPSSDMSDVMRSFFRGTAKKSKWQNVAGLLATRKTDLETAEAVGVSRTTVRNWRLHHRHFQAMLNAGRQIIDAMVEARFKAKCDAKENALMRTLTSNPFRDDAADEAAARQEIEAEIEARLN